LQIKNKQKTHGKNIKIKKDATGIMEKDFYIFTLRNKAKFRKFSTNSW